MFSIENSKKSKLETYKEFLLDHWGVLIFIPAILGGVLQILKLGSMDLSYIRFFAVEQVVPDGILLLFLFFIGIIFYKGFTSDKFKFEDIKLGCTWLNIFRNLLSYIIFIFMMVYLLIGVLKMDSSISKQVFKLVLEFLILRFIVLAYITIRYLYVFRDKVEFTEITDSELKKFLKKVVFYGDELRAYLLYVLIIIIGSYFLFGILNIYAEINTVKNIKNEEIYISNVKKELKISNDINIEYFNGKYIFLKIYSKSANEQYLVLKGEGFVNLLNEK